jgi:hypothetical protein
VKSVDFVFQDICPPPAPASGGERQLRLVLASRVYVPLRLSFLRGGGQRLEGDLIQTRDE